MATKTTTRTRSARSAARASRKGTRSIKKTARGVHRTASRARQHRVKTIDPGWTWDDRLPLAQAKQIGQMIYISGQVAYDASGNLVGEGDMKAQTRQVFKNIQAVLAAAGARMEDIIKINTYITDASQFMAMLEARSEIFGANPPASTAVVVSALAFPGLLIEVEAIAVNP